MCGIMSQVGEIIKRILKFKTILYFHDIKIIKFLHVHQAADEKFKTSLHFVHR